MRQVVFGETDWIGVSCLCAAADGTFFVGEKRYASNGYRMATVAVLKHLNKHGEVLSKTTYDQGDREITHIAELSDGRLVLGFSVSGCMDSTAEVVIKDTDIAFKLPPSDIDGNFRFGRMTIEVLVLKHQSNNDNNGRVVTLTPKGNVWVWDSHSGNLVVNFKPKMGHCLSMIEMKDGNMLFGGRGRLKVCRISSLAGTKSYTLASVSTVAWDNIDYLAETQVNGVQCLVTILHPGYSCGERELALWRLVENTSSSSSSDGDNPKRKKQMKEENEDDEKHKDDRREEYEKKLELIKEGSICASDIEMVLMLNDGTVGFIDKRKFARQDGDSAFLPHNASGFRIVDFCQLSDGTIVAARACGGIEMFRWDVRFVSRFSHIFKEGCER